MSNNLVKVEDDFQEENEISIYDIVNIFIKNINFIDTKCIFAVLGIALTDKKQKKDAEKVIFGNQVHYHNTWKSTYYINIPINIAKDNLFYLKMKISILKGIEFWYKVKNQFSVFWIKFLPYAC